MSLLHRRRILRTTVIAASVVALVAGSAGCARVVDGRAVLAGPRVGEPVQWQKCRLTGGVETQLPRDTECGRIAVPIDYNKPDGDVANLAMIRFPATGQKIGSLVVNPGGPGESGIEAAISMVESLPTPVRERFDFVGFDPRGVGSSTPELWCNSDADNDRLRADPEVDYTPEGVAHIENETKAFIQRCVDKMGPDFLANIGTANVAKDLDAIRAAIGDDKLTYLGYSYGTRIGAAYAEEFPQNVRAMILDGAVDPNADPIQADLDQAAAFQKAFDDFAADCAKSFDCPLGTDPSKSVAVYRDMVDPLVDKPAKTKDPRGLSYSDAIVGTIMALYSPSLWRHLTDGLVELRGRPRGHDAGAGGHVHAARPTGPLHQRDRRTCRGQLRRPAGDHRPRQGDRGGSPDAAGGAVHELRRVHRPRTDADLRVLAGPADQPAAPGIGAGAAAAAGGVHHA